MISSVSFGSETVESLVGKEPTYSAGKPSAASRVYDDDRFERSSGSAGKTVGKVVIAAAVVAGALALLRGKVQTFKDVDLTKTMKDQEKFTGKVKFAVAKAGEAVINAGKYVYKHIPFIGKKGEAAAKPEA